jgi:hypothetical protein
MSGTDGQPATGGDRSTVAGLAREFEQLYRDVRELCGLTGRVDDLAVTLAQLAETVTTGKQERPDEPAPCWIDHPADPGRDPAASRATRDAAGPGRDPAASRATRDAAGLLEELASWVGAVYLRYSDAVSGFPDCWMWHPDVVEELLWLHRAWLAAYSPDAPGTAVGDWHDRQRPGVVARIRAYAGMCSLEAHHPGQDRATPAPATPTADAVEAIAGWWATSRVQPGPIPTEEQIAAANARWRRPAGTNRR